MNNSINSVSFKGNLVTKMEGRHGLLKQVKKEFSTATKGMSGDLYVYRDNQQYPNAIVVSLNNAKDYIIHDYAELMGNKLESSKEVTKELVKKVTTTFVNIFKALKADVAYEDEVAALSSNINSARSNLRQNKTTADKLAQKGKTNESKVFETLADGNKRRLAKLEEQKRKLDIKYLKELDQMAENEPKLEVWRDVIKSDLLLK